MAQFVIPDFIKNNDVNTIHKRMRDNLPKNIDISEGSHPWNLTYPDAYEKAWLVQFCLINAIKLIWPKFSYGIYSDYHGEARGMERRKGQYATGYVVITAKANTFIPEGTIFSTEKIGNSSITEFETTATVIIEKADTPVRIPIAAVEVGKLGNVPAGTIVINSDKITGISSVTNPEQTGGGYDKEDDSTYNERIKEYDQTQDISFIGNDSDYRRWAMSVIGVGEAVVIDPEDNPKIEDDSGIVTIAIIDTNGNPASEALCAEVYNYIMKPSPLSLTGQRTEGEKTSIERLAPPGVTLVVTPPETKIISINVLIELDGTLADVDTIKSMYVEKLLTYILQAVQDGEVRYSKIASLLLSTSGVADYKELMLNGAQTNVQLSEYQIPIISAENILFTVGMVDG